MRSSSSSESVKRFGRLSLVLLLVLVALVIAAPAALAGPGSIEGTVTAAPGFDQPLQYIVVTAHFDGVAGLDSADGRYHPESVLTGADGKYTIPMLHSGFWYVEFSDTVHGVTHVWGNHWFAGDTGMLGVPDFTTINSIDRPDGAMSVQVFPNNVIPCNNVNAQLAMTSAIFGNVQSWAGTGLGGISVDPWYPGCGISWEDLVTAVETGRTGNDDAGLDTRRHLPEWVRDHMTSTSSLTPTLGDFEINPLDTITGSPAGTEPTSTPSGGYRLYFHDPSHAWAPGWWQYAKPWEMGADIPVINPFDVTEINMHLDEAATVDGYVNGAVSANTEIDLGGVHVSAVMEPEENQTLDGKSHGDEIILGEATTNSSGYYHIAGLREDNHYTIQFDPSRGGYDSAHSDMPYYGKSKHNIVVESGMNTQVDALLWPIPYVSWVHPPFGVNDGPTRYATDVTIGGWGMHFIGMQLVEEDPPITRPAWEINVLTDPFGVEYLDVNIPGTMAFATINLAAPLAPLGDYRLEYTWIDPWGGSHTQNVRDAYRVVNSYVAPQPVTPLPAVPVLPSTPTPITPAPVVPPAPTPITPVQPVAGAITVVAPDKASVKHGKRVTLHFRVNEAVLGGSNAVKITINNKRGAVVKTITKTVAMIAAASVSFKCNLAKGKYTFTVSATGAAKSASNTLTVK